VRRVETQTNEDTKLNTQVRKKHGGGYWASYGSMGWIEAAKDHAWNCGLANNDSVEVRDEHDESRPMATFQMRRTVSYEVINPRQGDES
jgi:hypothetical protein